MSIRQQRPAFQQRRPEGCMADEKMPVVLITGMLALFGTVAGGVVNGYWNSKVASEDFQSKLILRALEPVDKDQRKSSLEFLLKANLLSNDQIKAGLEQALQQDIIPHFAPAGVSPAPSAMARVTAADPSLANHTMAVVGLN